MTDSNNPTCHICGDELDPAWVHGGTNGHDWWKDDLGVFKHKHMTEQAATQVSKAQHDKTAVIAELLQEMGFDSPDEAPPTIQLLCKQAASNKPHATQALTKLRAIKGQSIEELQPGDECPMCGGKPEAIQVDMAPETRASMIRALEIVRDTQLARAAGESGQDVLRRSQYPDEEDDDEPAI